MKRFTLLLLSISLLLHSFNGFSQRSWGGTPISFINKNLTSDVDRIILPQPDMNLIMQEDLQDEKNGVMYKVGRVIPTSLNIDNSGTWDILNDGTQVWRLKISCRDAQSITLLYNNFNLPEGSKLFLFNENHKQLLGFYDNRTNPINGGKFSTQMIEGETTNLELILPSDIVREEVSLEIEGIVYNYRSVESMVGKYKSTKDTGYGLSGECNVNINCPEGDNFQTEKKGVAEIYIIDGMYAGSCSGTLVNNTANDGTPYFLTADHCGGDVPASDFAQWQFYFHFEAPTCADPSSEPSYETVIGCVFRSRGEQTGGTDFLLVELSTTVANIEAINGYYNGWDRTTTPSTAGVCIHHPSGDIKKISTYTDALTVQTYSGCMTNSHWHAIWVETATSWGITEGGSSGSPLFKGSNKLVVGTETGGASSCGVPVSSAWDEYGMFSQHWIANGGTDDVQLEPWLDPGTTGDLTCPGYDPSASLGDEPVADFSASPTTVIEGGTVDFTDLSTNTPTEWLWSFIGGATTSSTLQNPSIVYNTAGVYDVTLTATNATGSDDEIKTLYIEVIAAGTLSAAFSASPTVIAEGGNVDFTDESIGDITTWEWQFEGGPANSSLQNPSATYPTTGVYSVTLTVGDGTDTDEEIKTGYITVTDGTGSLQAAFIASAYDITAGDCINFNDQSVGLPTSWSWSFPGAATSTSTNQHPTNICYNTPGIYDVVLQVQNATDQDTYICEDCITVNPDPSMPIANFEGNVLTIPVGGVVHFTNLSENGPFNQWSWLFEGGTPIEFADSAPPPIAYMTPGTYDVELRCRKTNNVQDIEIKHDYITVIPAATTPPTANFTANYTVIQPGEQINFIDLSSGLPYQWEWEFEGVDPLQSTSNQQNPMGIQYDTEGQFYVKLTVSNNFGVDELTKELYIIVSEEDPCTEAPTAEFTASPRLIAAGNSVQFQDLSTGYPSAHTWSFIGASPSYSSEGSPTNGITYGTEGIYDVTLTVSNACGADIITKENYIYVFSGAVQSYCDTLTTVNEGETLQTWVPSGTWGFLAGNNGDVIKKYANYFYNYTFSQIKGVIVPITYAMYGDYNNYVKFCIWDGDENGPIDSLKLGEKKVYIRDLSQGQTNVIMFDTPISIDGPFYAGFEISNRDNDNDGVNDDLFAVPIVTSRGINPANNDLYLYKSGTWYSNNELYNFSSALPVKPITCLVDIEQLIAESEFDLYPNPTTGIITLQVKDNHYDNITIDIYDALGRKSNIEIISNGYDEYVIDMQSYPEGLYIMRINTGDYLINKKFILSK
jgi:PKD repeat protein